MSEDIKELKEDVKAIRTDIEHIKGTLLVNTSSLDIHIKRTEIAEKRIDQLSFWILGTLVAVLLTILGSYFHH